MSDTEKPATMKIALVQFGGVLGDVPANTVHAVDMIAEAAAQGADMVVLPELFSTGYHLDTVGPRMVDLAEPLDGPTVHALQGAACAGNCYVVAGLALLHGQPGVPYNSSVFIDREGEVLGTYDKVHLWALERYYFRPGNDYPVFETEFGKVGIMICYDMGFPEVARELTLNGAEILLCPSAWCAFDMDMWHVNVPCRALENTAFVAAVNRCAHEGEDLHMPGHSMVCNPRGTQIAFLEEEAEGILYAELDLSEVGLNRTRSPYLCNRRPDTYKRVTDWR